MCTWLMLSCAVYLVSPVVLSAETVRSRASGHFDAIVWTRNAAAVQATAPAGTNIPGGTESFAAMVLAEDDTIHGLFPRIERLGTLHYGNTDNNLVQLLVRLAASLRKKSVEESLLRSDRKFLSAITGYRLRRVPAVEHVFFSQPEGSDPAVRKSTVSLHTQIEGDRTILFIIVEASYGGGSWKITDIQFDSGSYAQFFITN